MMDLKPLFEDLVPDEQPPSQVDVGAAMRTGRRLRRRRRALTASVPLAAAAVTALVLATGSLADLGRRDASATPSPSAVSTGDIWPSAMTTIPAAASDGLAYTPVTALSATELLLRADTSFDRGGRLEVYDTAAGTTRVLGDMPQPAGARDYYPQAIEPGPEHIAWWAQDVRAQKPTDMWALPRAGGQAVLLARLSGPAAAVERLGVLRDRIVWSVRQGGLYAVPISGGAPQALPGTDGLHLVSWPWASDVRRYDTDLNQSVLVNLETGERTPLTTPSGARGMRCSLNWCVATLEGRTVVWSLPGGESRAVRGPLTPASQMRADRFINLGATVHDLVTGQSVEIGLKKSPGGTTWHSGVSSSPGLVFSWQAPSCGSSGSTSCGSGSGPELAVLNLAAVQG
jgi:LSD1 subclass zinc finger protein